MVKHGTCFPVIGSVPYGTRKSWVRTAQLAVSRTCMELLRRIFHGTDTPSKIASESWNGGNDAFMYKLQGAYEGTEYWFTIWTMLQIINPATSSWGLQYILLPIRRSVFVREIGTIKLTLTRNITASLPSSRRWSYVSARYIICRLVNCAPWIRKRCTIPGGFQPCRR